MNGNGNMAFDWSWIVALLIIAGIFGNGFGFGGNSGLTETYLDNRLMARDVFNTNDNVLTSACQTQRDVLDSKYSSQVSDCNLSKEIMQNRYDNALQTQTLSAQMNECCCATKQLIMDENQKTRDLIQSNYIDGLRTALSDAKAEISNYNQSSAILNQLGRFHAYPSCACGTGCTTYTQNLI